jgi:hypothetical protein
MCREFVLAYRQINPIIPNLNCKLLEHVIWHLLLQNSILVVVFRCVANFSFSKCVLPRRKVKKHELIRVNKVISNWKIGFGYSGKQIDRYKYVLERIDNVFYADDNVLVKRQCFELK